jgi:hypothetical protein
MGLRVDVEDEITGLDLSQHSETAYTLGGGMAGEFLSPAGHGAAHAHAAEARRVPA